MVRELEAGEAPKAAVDPAPAKVDLVAVAPVVA